MNQTLRKLRDNRIDLEKKLLDAREQELSYSNVCMDDVRDVLSSAGILSHADLLLMEQNDLNLKEFLSLCITSYTSTLNRGSLVHSKDIELL